MRQEQDRKKRQLDLLYQDRLSERITPEKYDEMSKDIVQEQKDIEDNISKIADKSRQQLKTGIDVLEKSQQAAKVYSLKSPAEKRKMLSELFIDLRLDGARLEVDYNPYSAAISKRVQEHLKVEKDFRTNKNALNNRGESELTEALKSVWRG